MSYGNVPDDWGCYYRKCERCGSTYHASEGGCDCHERDNCDEEGREWVEDGICRVTVQVARKDYPRQGIQKGDTYRKVVSRGYWEGGAWGPWETRRTLVKKAEDMETGRGRPVSGVPGRG